MNIKEEIDLFFTKRHAHRDASNNVDGSARRHLASLADHPREKARGTRKYSEAVQDVNLSHTVAELEDELRRGEDLQSVVGSHWPLTFGLLAIMVVEAVGAFLILQAQGIAPAQRPFVAIGLACTLFGTTKAAVWATRGKEAGRGSLLSYLIAPVAYVLLAFALVFIRLGEVEDEEATSTFTLAGGVVFAFITMGPALIAVWLERKRAPAVELARQITLIRTRLRDARRRVARAQAYLDQIDTKSLAYDRAVTRREALYSVEHEIARAQGVGKGS